MHQRQIRRLIFKARKLASTSNSVIIVALVIALYFAWSSVLAIQRNYNLQREINQKDTQLELVKLQVNTLKYQQKYYQTSEYLDLEARRRLGLAQPGESLLILPPNSQDVIADDDAYSQKSEALPERVVPPPVEQWIDFFFGAKS